MRRKTIRSTPGFFGTTVHHDANGRVVGKSMHGLFGTTVHRGKEGTVGRTTPESLAMRCLRLVIKIKNKTLTELGRC